MAKRLLVLSVLCMAVLFAGCSNVSRITAGGNKILQEDAVSIAPFESEELKKLEPHLGLKTGAFKLKNGSSSKNIIGSYEIWENGKLTQPGKLGGASIEAGFDGDALILLQEQNSGADNSSYKLVFIVGDGSCAKDGIPKYPSKTGGMYVKQLEKPQVIKVGENVPVWALVIEEGSTTAISNEESVEDVVKKPTTTWALVLKVGVSDSQNQ